jgi:hypothetical protein
VARRGLPVVLAVVLGAAASPPARARLRAVRSSLASRRARRLPRGVEAYPEKLVDRRPGVVGTSPTAPVHAETPAEVVTEYYEEHRPG